MNPRNEKVLLLAAAVSLVWLVTDAVLAGQTHLRLVGAVLVYPTLGLVLSLFVAARLRLARRAAEERRDRAQAGRERADTSLFGQDAETFEVYSLNRSHRQFERWVVPVFTALLALAQGYVAWRLYHGLQQPVDPAGHVLVAASLLAAQAFVMFLLSRFLLGLARTAAPGDSTVNEPDYGSLLRGVGVMLGLTCLASLLGAVAAVAGEKLYPPADRLATWILTAILGLLALETTLNFIWELYRPRRAGDLNRAYESRWGGLLTDPAGWVRNLGGAIDYQFGFNVSETWLYRFLERALLPLVIFQLLVLYLLSTPVFLGPGEQAIIERFGRPRTENGVLDSGFHLKWPWPFESARRFPGKKLLTTSIGFKEHAADSPAGQQADPSLVLWSVPHHAEEDQFLVASRTERPPTADPTAETTVPVSFLSFAVPVEYRIRDLYAYAYHHADPDRVLEQVAYRTLTLVAASRDLFEVMSAERGAMAAELRDRIQVEADRLRLGVEIVFVGLEGAHPPVSVAEAFQSVIGATEEREATIFRARAEANKILPLAQAKAAALEQQARAHAVRQQTIAAADADWFTQRRTAYRRSPAVFRTRLYLDTLERALVGSRKFVIAATAESEVYLLDFSEKVAPDLFDVGPAEED